MDLSEYLKAGSSLAAEISQNTKGAFVFEPAGRTSDKKKHNRNYFPYNYHIMDDIGRLISSIHFHDHKWGRIISKEPFMGVGIKGSLLSPNSAAKYSLVFKSAAYFRKEGPGEYQGVISKYRDYSYSKMLKALIEASKNL